MKKYIYLIFPAVLLLGCPLLSAGQNGSNNDLSFAYDSAFEARLVELAFENYPVTRINERKVTVAEKNVALERWRWLDNITFTYNINELNLRQQDSELYANQYYPRYNLGIGVNLGSFVSVPVRTRIAREGVHIAELELDQQKLAVKMEVLRRYHDYLLNMRMLKLHTQAFEDHHTTHLVVSSNFERGMSTLEEYMQSSVLYNRSIQQRISAETNVYVSRLMVEEMIGVRLENVAAASEFSEEIEEAEEVD